MSNKNPKLSNAGTDQIFNMAFDSENDAFRFINVGPTSDTSYTRDKSSATAETNSPVYKSETSPLYPVYVPPSVAETRPEIVYVDKPFVVEHHTKEVQVVEVEKQILVPSDVRIVEVEKQVVVTNTEYKTIEVPVIVEKPTIVEKQVVVEITKEVYPNWIKVLTIVQTVLVVALLIKAGI